MTELLEAAGVLFFGLVIVVVIVAVIKFIKTINKTVKKCDDLNTYIHTLWDIESRLNALETKCGTTKKDD